MVGLMKIKRGGSSCSFPRIFSPQLGHLLLSREILILQFEQRFTGFPPSSTVGNHISNYVKNFVFPVISHYRREKNREQITLTPVFTIQEKGVTV